MADEYKPKLSPHQAAILLAGMAQTLDAITADPQAVERLLADVAFRNLAQAVVEAERVAGPVERLRED